MASFCDSAIDRLAFRRGAGAFVFVVAADLDFTAGFAGVFFAPSPALPA
jgi:hypothetical protein